MPHDPEFETFQRATSFAARRHRAQLRKDGVTPYVAHVYRVAMTVRHVFGCDDVATLAAAVLHDTIEDTDTDFDDIEVAFGTRVAEIVAALTKNMILRDDERERDYDARLAAADWRARLIKLADCHDNLSDMQDIDDAGRSRAAARARRAIDLASNDPECAEARDILRSMLD